VNAPDATATGGKTWQIRGRPSDVEVAAVVAALSAAAAAASAGGAEQAPAGSDNLGVWSAHWRAHRAPVQVGLAAWRASGWSRG
jgi:hypothetical protein